MGDEVWVHGAEEGRRNDVAELLTTKHVFARRVGQVGKEFTFVL